MAVRDTKLSSRLSKNIHLSHEFLPFYVILVFSSGSDKNQKGENGRVPFDQNFRKFQFKIEWNRKFLETRFENFGQPPRLSFLSETRKFRKFSVPFDISSQHDSSL